MTDLTARIAEILHGHSWRLGSGSSREDVAALIAAAAEQHYRPRVETVEQLDALPVGSVVRTTEGRVAEKTGEHWGNASGYGSWWNETGDEISCGSDELDDLPAIVVWSPGAGE